MNHSIELLFKLLNGPLYCGKSGGSLPIFMLLAADQKYRHYSEEVNLIHTQFQVLSRKLPFLVILEILEVDVDVVIIIGPNHLDHL